MSKAWCLALALVSLGLGRSEAADVKLSGLIFGQYAQWTSRKNATGSDVRGRGDFSISRIYLNGEAKFTPKLKGKVVIEGNTNAGNAVFLKNAFGDYSFNDYVSAHFGLLGTPWIGHEEKIWGRRYVQKVHTDNEGVLSSADKGVAALVKLPKGYGDFHAIYVNGEGTTATELTTGNNDGRYKDAAARLTVLPLPENAVLSGLKLHGYVHQGRIKFGQAQRRDRYLGGLSYEHKKFHAMWSYFESRNGDGTLNRKTAGYSLHGSVRLPKAFAAFGRYDRINKAATGTTGATVTDMYSRGILGVEYKLTDGVRFSLNDQWLSVRSPISTARNHENQVLAQCEMKF